MTIRATEHSPLLSQPTSALFCPKAPAELSTNEKMSNLMGAALASKVEKKDDIEEKRKTFLGRFNPLDLDADAWLLGGDFFSMGFLGFQAAQCFSTAIATNTVVQGFTLGFGIVGGVINIAVGASCIVQGIKELNKGHKVDGLRLLFDGVLMIAIGAIMILGPILLKVAAGSALTAFLTNPILLPILFALLSAFITYEILKKVVPMRMGTDLGTQLMNQLKAGIDDQEQVQQLLSTFLSTEVKDEKTGKKHTYSFEDMQNLLEKGDHETVKKILCTKMNQFEEKVGVKAAIEVFQLMQTLLELKAGQDHEKELTRAFEVAEIGCRNSFLQAQGLLTKAIGRDQAVEALREIEGSESINIEAFLDKYLSLSGKIHDITTHPEFDSVNPQVVTAKKIYRHLHKMQEYQGRIEQIESRRLPHTELIASKKGAVEAQKPVLQQLFKEWKVAQHVRLAQQILYIGASVATFGALGKPTAIANGINGGVNVAMAIANLIPLGMDWKWPYKRNVPVIVPGVTVEDIDHQLEMQEVRRSAGI